MVEFGEQLRRAREGKGMTQQSLAEQLYVTRQSVSRWECGDRYPDLLTTKKISQILDVSLTGWKRNGNSVRKKACNRKKECKLYNDCSLCVYCILILNYNN